MHLLEVKNLHVEVDGKQILNGLELSVSKGTVHAIMGPNGSGKSTLAHVLAGKADYVVTRGEVLLDGEDILALAPDERASQGAFSRLPISARNPGRRHHDLPAHRAQCAAQETRRSRALGAPIRQARERGRGQARHRPGHAAPRGQCRLFRRREEAQRDPADGAAGAAAVRARRDRFRPRHRRAQGRRRRRQPAALARTRRSW